MPGPSIIDAPSTWQLITRILSVATGALVTVGAAILVYVLSCIQGIQSSVQAMDVRVSKIEASRITSREALELMSSINVRMAEMPYIIKKLDDLSSAVERLEDRSIVHNSKYELYTTDGAG